MIESPQYVKELLRKQMMRTIQPAEQQLLFLAYDLYTTDELEQLVAELEEELGDTYVSDNKEPDTEYIIQQFKQKQVRLRRINKATTTLAACIVLVIGIVLWRYVLQQSQQNEYACEEERSGEIPTIGLFAYWKSGEEPEQRVDSTRVGTISKLGGVWVRMEPGLLHFNKENNASADTSWQTIRTERQQQYQVLLSDGTAIRMNANTVIRFPASFEGAHRRLQVEGEVFIQAPLTGAPLIIHTKNGKLSGKSGELNVSTFFGSTAAYLESGDNFVFTTSLNKQQQLLRCHQLQVIQWKPSPMAQYFSDSIVVIKRVDATAITQWKNKERLYQQQSLVAYVRDMCSWYGLQLDGVVCIKNVLVNARLCYKAPIHDALAILRQYDERFTRQGDQLSFCDPRKRNYRLENKEGFGLLTDLR